MRKQLLALFSIPVFVTPYLPDDFADDLAEAAEQFRSFHGIHSAVVGSLRARGRTDEQIIDILEYVMEHPDEFHPGSDGNAAGCLELLNSTNALKMIREHPDDARLVAFFETVRTNALESARATVPTERRDSTPPPVSTNRVSEAGAPAVQDGAAAASDPWAGLLDDLPEKKPWTPPPGYEPPF